eukprot:GHRR01024423.1.p1 GENE.GHRR01024423.1~~GHRR01024423.1.p1  ORF type:complete len:187 (+),score=19.38 GHRR01024423.1:78-638(+)
MRPCYTLTSDKPAVACARDVLSCRTVSAEHVNFNSTRFCTSLSFLLRVTRGTIIPTSDRNALFPVAVSPVAVLVMNTPFGSSAQIEAFSTDGPGKGAVTRPAASLTSGKSYKLVKSETGDNLFVEAREYDPLAHHRPRNKEANKGEGLGFLFCCFAPKVEEPAATAERHYSVQPSASMDTPSDKTL